VLFAIQVYAPLGLARAESRHFELDDRTCTGNVASSSTFNGTTLTYSSLDGGWGTERFLPRFVRVLGAVPGSAELIPDLYPFSTYSNPTTNL
jgi:hypothetical protein